MRAGGQAPQQHGAEEHSLDANAVNQAALQDEANGITDLKPEVDVGVIHRRPAHLFGQNRLHHAQCGAVDEVQRGGEKDQREHSPSGLAGRHGTAKLAAEARVRNALDRRSTCSLRRDHEVVTCFLELLCGVAHVQQVTRV